ncbi:MAG TPA: hypothetical protein VGM07_13860 [Stellaceae bacterium]
MDKKIAGMLGAVAGLATIGSAQAAINPAPAPSAAPQPSSYADLLAPIPDAVAALKADDAARAQQPASKSADGFQVAQAYYYPPYSYPYYNYHHHHHHHHTYYRRYSNHHHHHHHHNNAFVGIPGVGGVVIRGR